MKRRRISLILKKKLINNKERYEENSEILYQFLFDSKKNLKLKLKQEIFDLIKNIL